MASIPASSIPAPEISLDTEAVARVLAGSVDAFGELVERHQQRVYRTLMGILGNREEAEDGAQTAFLKAYQHLNSFQGESRFSTWLVRIAINEGLERLRRRRHNVESLDDAGDSEDEGFRPRQVRAWEDNPEESYSKAEIAGLVESAVLRLPYRYRVVVMMRDMEELSTEETAGALALSETAVKTRLMRGRLILRETLAPAFRRRPGSLPNSQQGDAQNV